MFYTVVEEVSHAVGGISFSQEALKALGNLQSNETYVRSARDSNFSLDRRRLQDMEKYLHRSGLTVEQLDALSVIHVAGTKGKGSTCAYVESILGNEGYRTGLFSSPHLVSVRERIRIDRRPISETDFARYFWKLYDRLDRKKDNQLDMPMYFKFLTIMMFHVFLEEAVDVAIIEVGIGGELDCTNVIRKPVCVGITSLGLEHTCLLGNTIEEIAYQKAGTLKSNAFAFTVPQVPQAMKVLESRAQEKRCTLSIVPPLESYQWRSALPISFPSLARAYNASLAIQLSLKWMALRGFPSSTVTSHRWDVQNALAATVTTTTTMDRLAAGLASCAWPGRTQILPSSLADFYLDGAHTVESMEHCVCWFNDATLGKMGKTGKTGKRLLLFNVTGNRDPRKLLALLKPLNFHTAYFVPNIAGVSSADASMNYQARTDRAEMDKCKEYARIWAEGAVTRRNVISVLDEIRGFNRAEEPDKPQVLVTGSLHLVGAVLAVLDPNLTMTTNY